MLENRFATLSSRERWDCRETTVLRAHASRETVLALRRSKGMVVDPARPRITKRRVLLRQPCRR